MKSVFFSILALCLALALLLPMAAASGESGPSTSMLTDEESFRYALMQLNSYLSGSDRRDTTIQSVQRELDKVKNFDALGVPFLSYANALTAVEAGDFSRAQVYLTILESNSRLKDRLENEDFQRQYPNIRGVELLRRYTEGRQKEAEGDSLKQQGRWPDARACWDEAMDIYLRCDGFNDSMDRYIQLAFVPTPSPAPVTPLPAVTPSPALKPLEQYDSQIPNPSLLPGGEAERKSANGFLQIALREALEAYIGQTVTISLDIKADRDVLLLVYPYQESGVSIADTFHLPAATEYQRFSFTTTVKDFGRSIAGLTPGALGIYDQSPANKASFTVRRVKIELGAQVTPLEHPNAQFLEYQALEDGTAEITKCKEGYPEQFEIPAFLGGYAVSRIGDNAFLGCDRLTVVVIQDGIQEIGSQTFYGCSNLASMTISNSVTTIGRYAFGDCSSLASMTIPNSVTTIGSYAFWKCTCLASMTIPNSVTTIGSYAFGYCPSLSSVTIPDSVTTIGSYAFYDCSSLSSVIIPNSVTSIGDCAFRACVNLTSVTLSSNLVVLPAFGFCECSSLTSVTIPGSVTTIGRSAFSQCTSLTNVTIPDGVKTIEKGAFRDCSLTDVILPNSVTSIGETVFCDCDKLTSVTLSSALTVIPRGIFESCVQLSNVPIPSGVQRIEGYAFYECESLSAISIPDSVTSIEEMAFCRCSSLTSVAIPSSVASIGPAAFYECASLKTITIPSHVINIGAYAFDHCPNLTCVVASGSYAETYCRGLNIPYRVQ